MKNQTTIETAAPEMRAPSKSEEIAILRDAIARLGPLSYCGPWLSEQLAGIENDIRSDYLPQISMAATATLCGERLTEAHDRAAEIVAAAEKTAKATIERARADAEAIRESVARSINAAQHAINRY